MKTNGATRIPALESIPEYAALIAKRTEIERTRVGVQGEVDKLLRAISETTTPMAVVKRGQRVAELLGDPAPADVPDNSKIPPLNQRLADLRIARVEIDRRISEARLAASRKICEAIKPEYGEVVRRLCMALLAVHEAHLDYRQFAGELNDADLAWSGYLTPMHPQMLGDPRDPQSRLGIYLRDAVEHGLLDDSEVPDELAWPPRSDMAKLRNAAARRFSGKKKPVPTPLAEARSPGASQ